MAQYYFSAELEDNRTLYLSPLTDRWIALSGEELADTSGYFLYEKCGEGLASSIEIIAQVQSDDAALRLREMFKMS